MNIEISSKKIAWRLWTAAWVLGVIHLSFQAIKFVTGHDHFFGLIPMFDLNGENNIPTLYSFMLLLAAAKLFGWSAYEASNHRKSFVAHWAGLSAVFVFLSLDEMLCIHEQWIDFMRGCFHASGLFYYCWQLPYILLAALLMIFYFPFFKGLEKNLRKRMFLAAGVYLTGVIAIESLSGMHISAGGKETDLVYVLLSTLEEISEMGGIIILIYGLLEHARLEIKEIRLKWA